MPASAAIACLLVQYILVTAVVSLKQHLPIIEAQKYYSVGLFSRPTVSDPLYLKGLSGASLHLSVHLFGYSYGSAVERLVFAHQRKMNRHSQDMTLSLVNPWVMSPNAGAADLQIFNQRRAMELIACRVCGAAAYVGESRQCIVCTCPV